MTKDEILSLSLWRLRVAIALNLGIAVYCHKNKDSCALRFIVWGVAPNTVSLGWWDHVTDLSAIPDEGTWDVTDGKYWYTTMVSSLPYLRSRLKTEEQQVRYTDALMEICMVEASLVFYDGVGWADYPGLWRLASASDEQQMRAWLIAKSCV